MSPEDTSALEADLDKSVGRMIAAKTAIVEHHEATGEKTGTIACPNCGGNLRFARQDWNGHIRAKCETSGCVHFIE